MIAIFASHNALSSVDFPDEGLPIIDTIALFIEILYRLPVKSDSPFSFLQNIP